MLDFDIVAVVFFTILYIPIMLFLKISRKKTFSYLFICTLLYIYLVIVIKYTQFPIIFDDVFVGAFKGYNVNLNIIPLITLRKEHLVESLLNIILFLPFGFLFFIVTRFKYKTTVIVGVLLSFFIEIIQFIISMYTGVYLRVTDINDILFNTTGILLGMICFLIFRFIAKKITLKLSIESNGLITTVLGN